MSDGASTRNDFLIGVNSAGMAPILPVMITTQQQAYRTAAWLVAMGCMLPKEEPASSFDEVLKAIQNT